MKALSRRFRRVEAVYCKDKFSFATKNVSFCEWQISIEKNCDFSRFVLKKKILLKHGHNNYKMLVIFY